MKSKAYPAHNRGPMTDLLSNLPLFATDRQLAEAVVGKERATMWIKTVIPQLERKGFPRIDPLHDGRPVPLVKKFYDGYFGITAGFAATGPDGKEDWSGSWRKRKDTKTTIPINGNIEPVLRYMIDHPDCTTVAVIPGAGLKKMARLIEAGVIEEIEPDFDGDRQWRVTDLGRSSVSSRGRRP